MENITILQNNETDNNSINAVKKTKEVRYTTRNRRNMRKKKNTTSSKNNIISTQNNVNKDIPDVKSVQDNVNKDKILNIQNNNVQDNLNQVQDNLNIQNNNIQDNLNQVQDNKNVNVQDNLNQVQDNLNQVQDNKNVNVQDNLNKNVQDNLNQVQDNLNKNKILNIQNNNIQDNLNQVINTNKDQDIVINTNKEIVKSINTNQDLVINTNKNIVKNINTNQDVIVKATEIILLHFKDGLLINNKNEFEKNIRIIFNNPIYEELCNQLIELFNIDEKFHSIINNTNTRNPLLTKLIYNLFIMEIKIIRKRIKELNSDDSISSKFMNDLFEVMNNKIELVNKILGEKDTDVLIKEYEKNDISNQDIKILNITNNTFNNNNNKVKEDKKVNEDTNQILKNNNLTIEVVNKIKEASNKEKNIKFKEVGNKIIQDNKVKEVTNLTIQDGNQVKQDGNQVKQDGNIIIEGGHSFEKTINSHNKTIKKLETMYDIINYVNNYKSSKTSKYEYNQIKDNIYNKIDRFRNKLLDISDDNKNSKKIMYILNNKNKFIEPLNIKYLIENINLKY